MTPTYNFIGASAAIIAISPAIAAEPAFTN